MKEISIKRIISILSDPQNTSSQPFIPQKTNKLLHFEQDKEYRWHKLGEVHVILMHEVKDFQCNLIVL